MSGSPRGGFPPPNATPAKYLRRTLMTCLAVAARVGEPCSVMHRPRTSGGSLANPEAV